MKKADKERMYENIQKHGENLNKIFNTNLEPVTLCKKLFRIEKIMNLRATEYCNGEMDCEDWESLCRLQENKIDKILNHIEKNIPVIFNADARGYTLKIDDAWMRSNDMYYKLYQDWGGYGIIAPDFNPQA